jgi:hypothetical protein
MKVPVNVPGELAKRLSGWDTLKPNGSTEAPPREWNGFGGFLNNNMQPHEKRVVTEKQELDEKLAKLKEFCFDPGSPTFSALPPQDRDLLEDQYTVMEKYSTILGERIQRLQKRESGMIEVKPLQDFSFAISEFNKDAIIKALKDIQGFPRLQKLVVHNKTKSVHVGCTMQNNELHIYVTNPKDQEFDVNS